MSGLPEGWVEASVSELTDVRAPICYGVLKPGERDQGVVPMIRVTDIRGDVLESSQLMLISPQLDEEFSRSRVGGGDVLLSIQGTVGRVAVVPHDMPAANISRTIARIRPVSPDLSRWLWAALRTPQMQEAMKDETGGTTRDSLNIGALREVLIRLPPAAEQRRIVAKLDALTARTARARADLDRIPALAARYTQAVLAKAFSGELTADVAAHDQTLLGPQSQLELCLDDQDRGTWSVKELPGGWTWLPFSRIFEDVTDSRRKLPTREYLAAGRFPVVDQGEVPIPGFTDREDLVNRSTPPNIVFGDHTRCVKYVTDRFVQGADGVKVLKPRPIVDPRYAELLLRGINVPNKGYSRHMKFLRASYFPICSVAVQHEVVRRVDRALAYIDRLTTEAAAARRLLDRLDQSILAKAFRGELVLQDPADEPASVLLARIRAERAAAPKARKGRKAAA